MSPASLETFIDMLNCVLEDRVQYYGAHSECILWRPSLTRQLCGDSSNKLSFSSHPRENLGGERSGDLEGQMVLEMILFANTLSKSAIDILYCNRQVHREFRSPCITGLYVRRLKISTEVKCLKFLHRGSIFWSDWRKWRNKQPLRLQTQFAIRKYNENCAFNLFWHILYTQTHTHTHIYIYISIFKPRFIKPFHSQPMPRNSFSW